MTEESKPKRPGALRDDLLTPELAKTEVAPWADAATRTGPRATEPKEAARAPRVVGRFRIDAQLGSGGMGDVYRAYDPVLDRAVALKVLHGDRFADDAQRMRRVVREARAAAALTHPNTVTIFEVGEADREVFIAMELLLGEDLRAVLERGAAPLADKLRWLLEAARALGAAHERGLVHRDVKPENMFVCAGGTLKLLDFGIAKRDDDDGTVPEAAVDMGPSSLRTTEGRRIGTPRYMAPEQHAGDATDPRTDQYAWGLVAFELLSGGAHVVADLRTKTTDGSDVSPVPALVAQRLEVLRAAAPEVSEHVLAAIGRALEPKKEERFPSMAPIIAALEAKTEPRPEPAVAPPAVAPPAVAPMHTPERARSWLVLPAIALAVAGGMIALRAATHATRGAGAGSGTDGLLAARAPTCVVSSSRTLPAGVDDRMAILPDGAVVTARDIRKGFALMMETPDGGKVPALTNPLMSVIGHHYGNLQLSGLTYDGRPATLVHFDQAELGAFVGVFSPDAAMTQRIPGTVNGIAATNFGKNVVVVATAPDGGAPLQWDLTTGVEAFLLGGPAGTHRTSIEEQGAAAPSVASLPGRVAVVYQVKDELHFVFLDEGLSRIGDVLIVARATAAPVVAFAPGDAPAVFWVDDAGGKTRLYGSALIAGTPGNKVFAPPKIAFDEPLAPRPPVTARLPDGSWAVAWIASTGGLATLRVSRIGEAGALDAPSDLASSARIDGLRSVATAKGIDFWWYESDVLVRIVEVTCAAPARR